MTEVADKQQGMSREIALKIALATRAIPGMSVARLLDILQEKIPGQLTETSLRSITLPVLQSAVVDLGVDMADVKNAAAILRGGIGENQPVALGPVVEDNSAPLANAVRVAIASNEGEQLNGHFGSCSCFLIYDINGEQQRLVDIRSTAGAEQAEDKNAYRTRLIDDCQVVYFISVGGPAAAKIIRAGIYPIKNQNVVAARDALGKLQGVMKTSPPPWLAKILGATAESRVRFAVSQEVLAGV